MSEHKALLDQLGSQKYAVLSQGMETLKDEVLKLPQHYGLPPESPAAAACVEMARQINWLLDQARSITPGKPKPAGLSPDTQPVVDHNADLDSMLS